MPSSSKNWMRSPHFFLGKVPQHTVSRLLIHVVFADLVRVGAAEGLRDDANAEVLPGLGHTAQNGPGLRADVHLLKLWRQL